MKRTVILTLLLTILLSSHAYADFQSKFTNHCKTNRTVFLRWWSHPHGGYRPADMVGADLGPGKSHFVKWFYQPGVYEVHFSGRNGKNPRGILLKIGPNVTKIEFQDTEKGIIHIIRETEK